MVAIKQLTNWGDKSIKITNSQAYLVTQMQPSKSKLTWWAGEAAGSNSQLRLNIPISKNVSNQKFIVDFYLQTNKLLKSVNQISFQRELSFTTAHKDVSQNWFLTDFDFLKL